MEPATEIRHAMRALGRRPGIAATAVLALGLGIGLPTAMFSLLRATVTRGLPVDEPGELMALEQRPLGERGEGWGVRERDWLEWVRRQRSFEQLAAHDVEAVTVRAGVGSFRASVARVTPGLFSTLGVEPVLGRDFSPEDAVPSATPPVILSHQVWRDRLGSDPGALGSTLFVDADPFTVVGVMEDGFAYPSGQRLWVPLVIDGAAASGVGRRLGVVGRLSEGTSRSEASGDFARIAADLEALYPETNRNMAITVKPLTEHFMGETPVATMRVIVVAVLLVLLVACFNVANLLLVRAVERVRELAIRSALGAGRARIVRQMVLESGLLAASGAIVGIGVSVAAMRAVDAYTAADGRLGWWTRFEVDMPILSFVAALTVAAALVAGLLPAFKAVRTDIGATLKDESRGVSALSVGRVMRGLVVLEIALSLGLLVSTGLMVSSVANVRDVDHTIGATGVLTGAVALDARTPPDTRTTFYDRLSTDLASSPGVRSVAFASSLPAERAGFTPFALEGREPVDGSFDRTRVVRVSPGFFSVVDAPLVTGRDFDDTDSRDGAESVIVNQRFVERYFAGRSPLGVRMRLDDGDEDPVWRTIVGVAPDLYIGGLDASGDRNPAGLYVPLHRAPPATARVMIRAQGDPAALAPILRSTVAAADPDIPLFQVRTLSQVVTDNSWFYGLGAGLVGAAGITALLLAAIGLYGVVAFSVGSRVREFGIRMAIGAVPGGIVRLVLRRGAGQIGLGLVLGFGLAAVLARGVASLLFQVRPMDPLVFAAVGSVLAAVALIATLIPAVRASRVDPLEALRAE